MHLQPKHSINHYHSADSGVTKDGMLNLDSYPATDESMSNSVCCIVCSKNGLW